MKNIYLYGAGKICEDAFKAGVFKGYTINGIFDKDQSLYEKDFIGYKVEAPRYLENVKVCVTSEYRTEMIQYLLKIGYKKFAVLHNIEGTWVIKEYDYSTYQHLEEKPRKMLFMARNMSGSNVAALYKTAIEEMESDWELIFRQGVLDDDIFYQIITSECIVLEYDREYLPPNKKYIQLWHGFGPKGSGFRNKLLTDKKLIKKMIDKWLNYDIVCSYSDTYSTIIGSCYCVPSYKVRVTGMPRNDVLLTSKHSFLEKFPECEGNKVIVYMPTFRQQKGASLSGDDTGFIYNFPDFDYSLFNEECKNRGWVFITKHHVFDSDKDVNDYSNLKFITDEMLTIDMYEYLGSSDLLVTDYSSVFTDYLLLNKPILFVGKDMNEYSRDRGFLFEPIEEWLPGPIVNNVNDLYLEIDKLLSNRQYFEEKRKKICDISHRYKDANSGKRIIKIIKDEL